MPEELKSDGFFHRIVEKVISTLIVGLVVGFFVILWKDDNQFNKELDMIRDRLNKQESLILSLQSTFLSQISENGAQIDILRDYLNSFTLRTSRELNKLERLDKTINISTNLSLTVSNFVDAPRKQIESNLSKEIKEKFNVQQSLK